MMTKFKLLAVLTLLIFSTISMTYVPDTYIITLNVDTSTINDANVRDVCFFTPEQEVNIEDYNTEVRINDIVVWVGVSSSNPDGDRVMINSINHEGGARVFDRNVLRDSSQNPGVVVGVVKEGRDGDVEKYKVSFKVFNSGVQRGGTYHIDPKLTIKN